LYNPRFKKKKKVIKATGKSEGLIAGKNNKKWSPRGTIISSILTNCHPW
jgi:hypothetical protein